MNIFALIATLTLLLLPTGGWSAHGISLDDHLKYPENFKAFAYTSPHAVVGGTLTLHDQGTFDKMNPYTLKGEAPAHMNELMFETLTVHSLDEPASQYGLLAQNIQVAKDGLSVTYTLNPKARFADGSPVTPQDVVYSFETLKSDQAHPFFQTYWRDIFSAEVVGKRKVRFNFARKNRELSLITGDLPVFSRKWFASHPFDKGGLEVPLTSGPYLVDSFDPGKVITYRRNPNYWGWKLPVRKGMFNFERVVVKYFKDPVVAREAFMAGEFDFIVVINSKEWARDYAGPRFRPQGPLVKEALPHKNGAGMQALVFNVRRPKFQDKRVRQALNLAFDFEWSNRNLFYQQYTRSESFFSNSELAASGLPTEAELALLEPLREKLDPVVFGEFAKPPTTAPPHTLRGNLVRAKKLLDEAGYRVNPATNLLEDPRGEPLRIEMILVSPAFERVIAAYAHNLKKLGITIDYRTVDKSLYQRRVDQFDYDMIVHVFGQSQNPGNEQRNFWHSASADINGSANLIGLKDPAVDSLVNHIIYAEDRDELVTACRALDRVLMAGYYVVPNWHIPYHRVAYKRVFERPPAMPTYYAPTDWLWSWWFDPALQPLPKW